MFHDPHFVRRADEPVAPLPFEQQGEVSGEQVLLVGGERPSKDRQGPLNQSLLRAPHLPRQKAEKIRSSTASETSIPRIFPADASAALRSTRAASMGASPNAASAAARSARRDSSNSI